MPMKCTIPGISLKIFGRAIQSLSKIGDELYFEPLDDGLYLRSVSLCRSAYACFKFAPNFFIQYSSGSVIDPSNVDEDAVRCKIGMKSIMTVFRSLATIFKTVEKCIISLNMTEARLVFQMHCRHGIIKTHNLAFIECETLQAVYSKDLCPNKFTAPPKLLCEAVLNFQNSQEEITLSIRPDYIALKNYIDDEPDPNKVMRTELTLSPNEFENYQAGMDSDVTFCLRELRAILGFCDLTGLTLTAQFEQPGRPITFSITSDPTFEANFVLATLAETDSSSSQQSQPATQKTQQSNSTGRAVTSKNMMQNGGSKSHKNTSSNNRINHQGHYSSHQQSGSCRTSFGEDSIMMDISVPDDSMSHPTRHQPTSDLSKTLVSAQRPSAEPDETHRGEGSSSLHKVRTLSSYKNHSLASHLRSNLAVSGGGSVHKDNISSEANAASLTHNTSKKLSSVKPVSHSDEDVSPLVPLQNNRLTLPLSEDEAEDDEEIPATPPSKKMRALFFGTQSSTQSTQSQRNVEILAPDSDPD